MKNIMSYNEFSHPVNKIENTEWGKIYYYNFKEGRFALYIYDDDKTTSYLSNVFVNNRYRKNGIGNKILDMAVEESIKLGVDNIILKCLKDSWVHNWYNRNGFEDMCDDEEDNKYIWLNKSIKK